MAQLQHSHRRPEKKLDDINFKIRQVLNLLFMIIAIIGCLIYIDVIHLDNYEIKGAIVVVIAVMIKMAECMIRMLKKKPVEEE